MASDQLLDHPDQVRSHGRSKTQMCLQKILDLISSHSSLRPCESSKQSLSLNPGIDDSELKVNGMGDQNKDFLWGNRGFNIDLNVRLGTPETTETVSVDGDGGLSESSAVGIDDCRDCAVGNSNSPVVSATVSIVNGKSSRSCTEVVREDDEKLYVSDLPAINASENEEESVVVDEQEATEFSETTNLQIRSLEIDKNGVYEETKGEKNSKATTDEDNEHVEESRSDGSLGLLIEAAKLIFGDFEDDELGSEKPSPNHTVREDSLTGTERDNTTRRSKRDHCLTMDLYGDFEDVSPVVRSKRGRSQVLPYRYRDSVLEPLTRLSRQRSTTVSTKRRSRPYNGVDSVDDDYFSPI
ncbi:hypothetical protein F0562_022168 [Nyssa sinensis]|uniref:Uncharacterized protein n=1 Tax=Nyssa sinensis TaxID=561372 RepID=A0A5J5BNC6_9ASTE|nr:hypothetical protein F0562_022168 [Nyssa sinensis]